MKDGRPLVAWDVDDVLNDLTRCWFDRWRSEFPGITFEMLRENPPDRILGISRAEYLESLDRFRHEAYDSLKPRPEVMAFLKRYGESFRHMAVTAAPRRFAAVSAARVMEHFGDWIRCFELVPSPRADRPVPVYEREKGEVLAGFRGKIILVDDSPKNLASARTAGCAALAFPAPWNEAGGRSGEEILSELLNWKSAE